MALEVDITVFGDRELERKLAKLEKTVQKKLIRRVFRKHGEVLRARIVGFLSGDPVEPRTGRLRAAMQAAPIRSSSESRQLIRIGIVWPTRAEFGIDPDDPVFYPAVVEYGHGTVPARPYMRPAIDNYAKFDMHRIRRRLARELKKEGLD